MPDSFSYDRVISCHGLEAVAFLSCLFPVRRPDRVLNLQERRLEPIIKRALGLVTARLKELQYCRGQNATDFTSCVERVAPATDSRLNSRPSLRA
jgi:DNA ligase 4